MLLRLAKIVLIVFAVFAGLVALQLLRSADDFWYYYFDNPEMLRDVRVVEGPADTANAPSLAHDFDGDGSADEFSVEYFHMEPVFSDDATSGLLRVRSGKDSSDLLVFPTATPMVSVAWAGDLDGNGTDDLRVTNDRRDVSLLHRR